MKTSAISVIIPTYNRASLISRAINSVLVQLEPDDELIVVNDGSTDNTDEVVGRFGSKLRYVKTSNAGAGAARNRGIREATRPLVAFLDSDDEWMPDHLLLLRNVIIARTDLLFCFSNFTTRFNDGNVRRFALETQSERDLDWHEIMGSARPISSFMTLPAGVVDCLCYEGTNLYRSQCCTSYVSVDTIIVRRSEAGENLKFAEDTTTAEEWECGARLARAGKGAYLHCESTMVHHHSGTQLTDLDLFDLATARLKIMERVWGIDQEFLQQHGDFYRARVREERLIRAERFLLRGKAHDARLELSKIENAPQIYMFMSKFPGWITKFLLDSRRAIKSVFK